METGIGVFRDEETRKTIHNNEWRFSIPDAVETVTDLGSSRHNSRKCVS